MNHLKFQFIGVLLSLCAAGCAQVKVTDSPPAVEKARGAQSGTHAGGGAAVEKRVSVGFGAIRERPSAEKVRAFHADAVLSMRNVQLMLPLSQVHETGGTVASAKDKVFSWRTGGFVTPARDQKTCGSCWAFAAVAAAEANWARRHGGQMIDASEQHILNCAPGNCDGGKLSDAVNFLFTKGTCKEGEDKYQAQKMQCSSKPVSYKAVGRDYVAGGNIPAVDKLKDALIEHGPIAAFIYAEGMDKESNFGANVVIADNPPDDGGAAAQKHYHFVLIVGWDDNKAGGKGAWEIKNTWRDDHGTWWGRDGFAFVAYHVRSVGDNAMWIEFAPGVPSPLLIPQSRFGLQ